MNAKLSQEQQIQEGEYSIPYHYIPAVDRDGFSQTLFWSWGMRYMAGLQRVLSELRKLQFTSILDVGCGDGRFLREVAREFHCTRILGVDYSNNAVSLARALNPSIDYLCVDVASHRIQEQFDVVTMVEVLEHIPIDQVQTFLAAIAGMVKKSGRLVLTVPHANKRVQDKHYQHFTSSHLRNTLSTHFNVETMEPFDRTSRVTALLSRLLGGTGSSYIITNRKVNQALYARILRHCLENQPEERCGRLLVVASPTL